MAQVLDHVADGVWLVTGTDVNWVLVADTDRVTLVDAGFPHDLPRVLSSLQQIGRSLGDLAAVVLTHAHPDHIGALERLRADRGVPVRLLDTEAPHARGEVIEQVSTAQILRAAWRPSALMWALRVVGKGGLHVERLAQVQAFEAGSAPLDVPGHLVPVPTPGHTSGHCAFHLPERGVLLVGDALMTAHPTGRAAGPQLLPAMFNHDDEAALASLQALALLSADVVVPGHGPAYRGSPASAVEQATAAHRRGAGAGT
jgi:glyoxylase-like metal-dependent hydrolase (beta-lactamase superfamily II)